MHGVAGMPALHNVLELQHVLVPEYRLAKTMQVC